MAATFIAKSHSGNDVCLQRDNMTDRIILLGLLSMKQRAAVKQIVCGLFFCIKATIISDLPK